MDYKLDIIGLARVDDEQTAEALARLCHEKLGAGVGSPSRPRFSQAAAVACRYCPIASARTRWRVRRQMKWRSRLNVLWTAAWMDNKSSAEPGDLKRCVLRSRRRTG
jgi:hypothetical protein